MDSHYQALDSFPPDSEPSDSKVTTENSNLKVHQVQSETYRPYMIPEWDFKFTKKVEYIDFLPCPREMNVQYIGDLPVEKYGLPMKEYFCECSECCGIFWVSVGMLNFIMAIILSCVGEFNSSGIPIVFFVLGGVLGCCFLKCSKKKEEKVIARLLKESREIIANRANRAGLKPPSYYENKNPAVLALNLKTETDEVMPSHHDNDQEPKAELKTQSEYNTPG